MENDWKEMCSCGKRPKHKCVKESETGTGKMCFREVTKNVDQA